MSQLTADLDALARTLENEQAGLKQLRKIRALWAGLVLLGLGTAWLPINPLPVAALAFAAILRWCIVAHHVMHGGYDDTCAHPGYHSKTFARGFRRLFDWMDWMHPDAWAYEHNTLHHYHLSEDADPDLVERNAAWLRQSGLPMWIRQTIVALGSMVWKPLYYAPNTYNELLNHKHRHQQPRVEFYSWQLWSPFRRRIWLVAWNCWLPYIAWRFVLLPVLFLPLGSSAVLSALVHLLLAELVSNAWSFWIIVPNHAGDDLFTFDTPTRSKRDFYFRQIVSSVDYNSGPVLDLLQGGLNYQVEHHLFPRMSLYAYQKAHPQVKALCQKHGIPFHQNSLRLRMAKTMNALTGVSAQPTFCESRVGV